jgi:hypothetical protein
MSFAEEFANLDLDRLERAYAAASGKLLIISEGGIDLVDQIHDYVAKVDAVSPGYASLFNLQNNAIEMLSTIPGMEYGPERHEMIRMITGILAAGIILSEYVRLEDEEVLE